MIPPDSLLFVCSADALPLAARRESPGRKPEGTAEAAMLAVAAQGLSLTACRKKIVPCLATCRKEAKSSFPLPPTGPRRLEGLAASRNQQHPWVKGAIHQLHVQAPSTRFMYGKFYLEKWPQPLGDLNLQRVC